LNFIFGLEYEYEFDSRSYVLNESNGYFSIDVENLRDEDIDNDSLDILDSSKSVNLHICISGENVEDIHKSEKELSLRIKNFIHKSKTSRTEDSFMMYVEPYTGSENIVLLVEYNKKDI